MARYGSSSRPEVPCEWLNLAERLRAEGHVGEAVRAGVEALRLLHGQSDSAGLRSPLVTREIEAWARLLLGEMYCEQGAREAARAELERALELGSQQANMSSRARELLARLGQNGQ